MTPPHRVEALCNDDRCLFVCLSVCLSVCLVPNLKSTSEGLSKLKFCRRVPFNNTHDTGDP